LFEAHRIRVLAGDLAISDRHVAQALERLAHQDMPSLSDLVSEV
jgi:hypothetical protein